MKWICKSCDPGCELIAEEGSNLSAKPKNCPFGDSYKFKDGTEYPNWVRTD